MLPLQAGRRAGQGTAGRVAGAERAGVQRSQDPDRPRYRGVRFPRIQSPPLPQRQAAHQAGRHGHQEVPGQACEGVPVTPRDQRRSGTGEDRPDRAGLGRLLPDGGVDQGVRRPDRLPVEAHLQVGVLEPPE